MCNLDKSEIEKCSLEKKGPKIPIKDGGFLRMKPKINLCHPMKKDAHVSEFSPPKLSENWPRPKIQILQLKISPKKEYQSQIGKTQNRALECAEPIHQG